MRFLVTGSEGMIGTRVVQDLLAEGHDVIGVDTAPARAAGHKHFCIDIRNLGDDASFRAAVQGVEYVIHLAARTDLGGAKLDDYEVNFCGSEAVYNVCNGIESLKAVIAVSTQLVLPIGTKTRDIVTLQDAETNLYGQSKVAMEQVTRAVLRKKFCIIRPTTIWGPKHNAHYMRFLKFLQRGLYFHPGKSDFPKSYGYVGNTSYQLIRLCKNHDAFRNGEVFYLCDYTPIYLERYINDICAGNGWRRPVRLPGLVSEFLAGIGDGLNAVGVPFPFNNFRLTNIRTSYTYDTARLEEVVGPLPYSYDTAMAEYVKWVRSQFARR